MQVEAEIVRSEAIAPGIYRLGLRAPELAGRAAPGQFVMVQAERLSLDPLLRRPFSIHAVSDGDILELLFKVVGRGTEVLASRRTGHRVSLLGPLGKGFHHQAGPAILVGGGMGIAPLRFLAGRMRAEEPGRSMTILLGARTRGEVEPLLADFTQHCADIQVATDDGTLGHAGLVTELMPRASAGAAPTVYCCGPFPMMKRVAAICREYGYTCQVSLETMMACGIAACLGCAVKTTDRQDYAHVCKDGPVFAADSVWWGE